MHKVLCFVKQENSTVAVETSRARSFFGDLEGVDLAKSLFENEIFLYDPTFSLLDSG